MSSAPDEQPLASGVWLPALEKFAAVTGLTVQLYDAGGKLAFGPIGPNPLFQLLKGYEPGIFEECARRCLEQDVDRSPIALRTAQGLGVVGVCLKRGEKPRASIVGGYVLVDFLNQFAIQELARESGVAFARAWEVSRRERPVPERRLVLVGELLRILGDALLREDHRISLDEETMRLSEKTAVAKDDFLAVLSHELRSPLTPIIAWAHILKAGGDPLRAADVIERNALLQARLVEDLLDVNQVMRGKTPLDLQPLDIRGALGSAVAAIAQAAEQKRIRLEFSGGEKPVLVRADAGRLQQILTNVLSNALKFTPPTGSIHVLLAREADQAVVTITDTGKGIAAEFLPFVFDLFRQQEEGTRRQYSGLGAGLAIVRRLVEAHQGKVAVSSPGMGLGTSVRLVLPLAVGTETASAIMHDTEVSSSARLDNLSILLVEDAEDVREATELVLKGLGAAVRSAPNGQKGLALAASSYFDIVLCDLRMPDMDGFEFIRKLHRSSRLVYLPVVALTALASQADHERTRDAGFLAHIDKPFNAARIVQAVTGALAAQTH
ncbi:MAG TPA: ATP-binding protein [Candidatus Polarisedimenticolia bacterium]|nr:ATP-binding protein [Candidatus Polarisedimenticolia bacterium]